MNTSPVLQVPVRAEPLPMRPAPSSLRPWLTLFGACLLLGPATPGLANPPVKPSIFVAQFQNGIGANGSGWQPAIGEGLADMLLTELSRSAKFEVLESTALADLREEIGLGEQGWVKFDEKVQRGEWDGADYMLKAAITRFGARTSSGGGFGNVIAAAGLPGGFQKKTQEAEVQIEWRIVDVENRRVRETGRAAGKHKGSSWSFGWITGGGGFSETEFLDSTLGKATMLALQKIAVDLEKLDLPPGRRTQRMATTAETKRQTAVDNVNALRETLGQVVGIGQDGSVVINLGTMHHLQPGDALTLFQPLETLNAEGKVIFTQQREVTTLTLSVVQEEFSKATLDHPASPREGWHVRWIATADGQVAAHR